MPKNKKDKNKHRKYYYANNDNKSDSTNSDIDNDNDGGLFNLSSNESDNIDFSNSEQKSDYDINNESDEFNDNDKIHRHNNLNEMLPVLNNNINNNPKNKTKIKILKNNSHIKGKKKIIKKVNKGVDVINSIENEFIKKTINQEERETFYRNSNIHYQELKENDSPIPPRLKNIIENLNYFSSVNVNIDDIIENDKTNVLIRNISLPYEQILNSILDEKHVDTDCLVCVFNGFKSKIIDLIKQKLNEHIYSENFCPVLASLFVSCYGNDLVKKSNSISKKLINKEKRILEYFDSKKNSIKNWTPASVLYHIKFHMDDPILFKKLTMLELKHQNENLKKNGLHKTFSEPKKGIEDNVIMDFKAHDAYLKNLNMMIKLQITKFEVNNAQNKISNSMLVEDYINTQKNKKMLTYNSGFTQTFLNKF